MRIARIFCFILFAFSLFSCHNEVLFNGDVSGIVTDAETSEPLDSVSIQLYPVIHGGYDTESGSDGSYWLKNITPGSYELTASKPRYAKVSRDIEVKPVDLNTNDFELDLAPYPEISVSYLDFEQETITKSFTIKNIGSGTLNYSCLENLDWVDIDHPNGAVTTEADTIMVTINRAAITEDTYKDIIRITSLSGEEEIKDTVHIYINGLLDKDGHYYRIVTIGSQTWMAENLNTGLRVNYGLESLQQDNDIVEKYCYDNAEGYCDIYGGLYRWEEMMGWPSPDSVYTGTTQGICPSGWHIPTGEEFQLLLDYVKPDEGGKLKATGTIEGGDGLWKAPNTGATDEYGFTMLPGGWIYYVEISEGVLDEYSGEFMAIGEVGALFKASQPDGFSPYGTFWYAEDVVYQGGYYSERSGGSVRCIKDSE